MRSLDEQLWKPPVFARENYAVRSHEGPDRSSCWFARRFRGRDRLRQRRSSLPRILGHRGARLLAPENTVPGFRAAITDGADGVELDVRRTADQALVCLHDAGLGRTTDGRGPVREHTLAEIRRLDAGGWFSREGPRGGNGCVRVPTLSEALDALPPDAL